MTGKDTNTAMNDQRYDHEPDRPGARRVRSRWWAVGLAGMTGLALTTSLGIGGAPAIGAVDGTVTAADGRPGKPHRASTDNKGHEGKGTKGKRRGTPVPCSADALIAAITLANARGGAVLDLAK
ncbi:right-handed parallel beta-helix repeat-containing protein, partial [Salinispora arenicola]|nr:right-handed parallel beta-helix repeat-containing protein [Salinispora arenicola]